MIDGLYDGHIASNKLRMTYCKTAPSLFFCQQLGQGICPGSTCRSLQQFFRSCCHLRFFLEEAKAFLRFF
ncbi:TPA: hypothetical protein ACSEI6_003406, partial [Klebsiella pneumoniae]